MDPQTIKGVWGFNGTERPGAVYLAAVLAGHAQKGLPAFGIYGHCRRNGCWFCPNASDAELRHMITHHPEMFDRLIEWEHEENVFHRRLTRRETPTEIKARLMSKPQPGLSVSKL